MLKQSCVFAIICSFFVVNAYADNNAYTRLSGASGYITDSAVATNGGDDDGTINFLVGAETPIDGMAHGAASAKNTGSGSTIKSLSVTKSTGAIPPYSYTTGGSPISFNNITSITLNTSARISAVDPTGGVAHGEVSVSW